MNVSEMLAGFVFVPSDTTPAITLDNQRRFYVNSSARRLLGIKPYERLSIAYNPSEKALAIVRPSANIASPERDASVYSIDKRYYMSARYFAENFGFKPEEAPFHFVYESGSADGTAFIFRL